MKLKSTPLGGKVKVKKRQIITFEKGLYGFEQVKKYILLDAPHSPFKWLCAINDEISFMVINPKIVDDNYSFRIDTVLEKIDAPNESNIAILCLIAISDNIQNMTVNLKSPLVINKKNNKAVQIILNKDNYELRYKLNNEMLK